MNKFLIIKCRNSSRLAGLIDRVVRRGLDAVPFLPQQVTIRSYPRHGALVFAAQAGDPLRTGGYTHVNDDSALCFSGVPYESGSLLSGSRSWASELQGILRVRGTERTYARLLGSYALAALNEDGSLAAFGDFVGMQPLYYFQSPELTAVSNRQWLLARICQPGDLPSYDLLALSWLPGHANIFGDRMVHQGVRLLTPGTYLEVNTQGDMETKPFESQFWRPYGDSYAELESVDFDRATEALLERFAPLKALSTDALWLSLTGGKDSRLNLAASLRSELRDKLRVFTAGPPGSPEIECAAFLCQHFGLQHHPQISARSRFDRQRTWDLLRYHPYLYEGSICPWDGLTGPATSTRVEINGFTGELYRTHAKRFREVEIETRDQAKKLFENYHQDADPLQVLLPEVREFQNRYVHDWVDRHADLGVPLNDLPEVFYVQNRLPLWSGILSSNSPSHVRITPLAHPVVSAICYRGGHAVRRSERMHFELLRRLDTWLPAAPFLKDTWDARLKPHWGDLPVATEPFAATVAPTSQNLVSWQWEFLEQARPEILTLLLDSPRSGLSEICRPQALRDLGKRLAGIRVGNEAKAVFSLLAVQLLLTGAHTAPKCSLLAQGELAELDTNLPDLRLEKSAGLQCLVRGSIRASSEIHTTLTPPSIQAMRRIQADERLGIQCLAFSLPHERIRRVRIDPTDAPGRHLLAAIELEVDDEVTAIDPRLPNSIEPNRQMKEVASIPEGLLWESLGSDPYCTIPALADLDLSGAKNAFLRVSLLVTAGARAEVFWDNGHGFSEGRKRVLRLATPVPGGPETLRGLLQT